MRLTNLLGAAVVVMALGGAGYWGATRYCEAQATSELRRLLAMAPGGIVATHGAVTVSLATRTLLIQDLSATGPNMKLTIPSVEISGISPRAVDVWRRFAGGVDATSEQDTFFVAEKMVIGGIKLNTERFDQSIARTEATNLRYRPWIEHQPGYPNQGQIAEAFQNLSAHAADGATAEPARTIAALKPLAQLMAFVALAADYDQVVQTDINGHVRDEQGATLVSVHYDSVVLQGGQHDGVLGEMEEIGLEETIKGAGRVCIGKVHLDGLDLHGPALAILRDDPLDMTMLEGLSAGAMSVADMTVETPDNQIIKLGEFRIDPIAVKGGHVGAGGFAFRDLIVDISKLPDDPKTKPIRDMGLTQLTVGMGVHFLWNPGRQELRFENTGLKIDELGDLNLDATLRASGPMENWQQLMQTVVLANGSVRFIDQSLTDKMLHLAALQGAGSAEVIRRGLITQIQLDQTRSAGRQHPSPLDGAFIAFLQKPGTLTLTAKSSVPLVAIIAGSAGSPDRLIDLLGLTATAAP